MTAEDDMFGDVPAEEPEKAPLTAEEIIAEKKAKEAKAQAPTVKEVADAVAGKVFEKAMPPAMAVETVPAKQTLKEVFTPTDQPIVDAEAQAKLEAEKKALSQKEQKAEMILNKLFTKGRIVKVSVGCPEFKKKLTLKDLGKKKEEVPEEIVSLGQKRLIKKSAMEEIKAIQSKAYSIIDIHSHESWIPTLRFMKDETAEMVKQELLELRKQYLVLAEDFIKKYPQLKEETLNEFEKWRDRLEPFYPHEDKVKKSFYFEISGFDDWRLTIVRKEAEVLEEATLTLKQSLMDKLEDFLKGSVLSARTQFIEHLQMVQEKLNSGEKVNAKTIKKIHEMIEEAKSKDISGDTEFFNMLDEFGKKFTPDAAKEKNFKDEIGGSLEKILAAAKDDSAGDKVAGEYVKRSILLDE